MKKTSIKTTAVAVATTVIAAAFTATATQPAAASIVDSTETIPYTLADQPRGTNIEAATDLGYMYTTTLAGDVTHAKMYYKAFNRSTPLYVSSPPNGWLNTASSVGSKASMYTVNGKDTYTYPKSCTLGGTEVKQITFTPDPMDTTVTSDTTTVVDCENNIWYDNSYLGWSGNYLYFQEYEAGSNGWETKVNRLDVTIPSPDSADLEYVGNYGTSINAFEADETHFLIAYSNPTELHNGSPGRVAYTPHTSSNVPHDTDIIGRFNSGGLGQLSLNPAGAVWSQNAPNGSATQIIVYRRAAETSHTYSGRLTGLTPTNPLATVEDPNGNVWLLWTDNTQGEDSLYWANGKINALQVAGTTQTTYSTYSAGQMMPTPNGKLVAYTPTSLTQPVITTFNATVNGNPTTYQTSNIDPLPAPVFALGTSSESLWATLRPWYTKSGYNLKSWKYAGDTSVTNANRHTQFKPNVNSEVSNQGGNLAAVGDTAYFHGRNENNPDVWTGVHAVTTNGNTSWGVANDITTGMSLANASPQAVGWRYKDNGQYKGKYSDAATGKPTVDMPSDIAAHTVAGGVYYYAPNGQIGYINRGYIGSPNTDLIPVDLSCTINVEAAYKNLILYDCGGIKKIAELTWNGTGFTAATTMLASLNTDWRLGDGFLAYRVKNPSNNEYTFGVYNLTDETYTTVATVDTYDTTYGDFDRPAPEFTADLTGGHRFIYADGDQNLHVVKLNVPDNPPPNAAAVTIPRDTFTPDGNGVNDMWNASIIWNDEPSTWRLTFRDTANQIVKTYTGSPAAATPQNVTVEWDGKTDQGNPAGDGRYTWILESTPVNDVQTTVQTGTVTIRKTSTKPGVDPVPFIASSDQIPVTVTTPLPTGVVGWQPLIQTVTNNTDGTTNVSAWSAAGAVSDARTIYVPAPRNTKVNVKLSPNDTLGEPIDSDTVTAIVPADGQDLKTTKKWSNVTNLNAYMSTLRATKKHKAKIVYSVNGPGKVYITGLKNKTQGKYWVWLDGKKTTKKPYTAYKKGGSSNTVNLYISPNLKPGKHTVTLQNHVQKKPKQWKKRNRLTVDSAYLYN